MNVENWSTREDVWPKYDGRNECTQCLLVSTCVDENHNCCIHASKPTIEMCTRCRHRKEVMLK